MPFLGKDKIIEMLKNLLKKQKDFDDVEKDEDNEQI